MISSETPDDLANQSLTTAVVMSASDVVDGARSGIEVP
jgi:hypothetical protein